MKRRRQSAGKKWFKELLIGVVTVGIAVGVFLWVRSRAGSQPAGPFEQPKAASRPEQTSSPPQPRVSDLKEKLGFGDEIETDPPEPEPQPREVSSRSSEEKTDSRQLAGVFPREELDRAIEYLWRDAPRRRVSYLGEDWSTRGDWPTRYGEGAWILCGTGATYDHEGGPLREELKIRHYLSEKKREGDYIRHWLHWPRTTDPRTLHLPPAGFRRQAEWDDHGETYPMSHEGPHLCVDLAIPRGTYRLSLYFFNKDGLRRNNRYRDYRVAIKPYAHSDARWEAAPTLARCRVHDFRSGLYKRFIIRGGRYSLRILRAGSFNTILSGVFLDPISRPRVWSPGGMRPVPEGPRSRRELEESVEESLTRQRDLIEADAPPRELARLWRERVAFFTGALADRGKSIGWRALYGRAVGLLILKWLDRTEECLPPGESTARLLAWREPVLRLLGDFEGAEGALVGTIQMKSGGDERRLVSELASAIDSRPPRGGMDPLGGALAEQYMAAVRGSYNSEGAARVLRNFAIRMADRGMGTLAREAFGEYETVVGESELSAADQRLKARIARTARLPQEAQAARHRALERTEPGSPQWARQMTRRVGRMAKKDAPASRIKAQLARIRRELGAGSYALREAHLDACRTAAGAGRKKLAKEMIQTYEDHYGASKTTKELKDQLQKESNR